MDRYTERMNVIGLTQRDRNINKLKRDILNNVQSNPSCKKVKLNGVDTYVVINSGTNPYYKEFTSLPNENIVAGDYIEWANRTWLVYDADCDGEVCVDGELRECQTKLYWQNNKGEILSRWVWIQNASAYNNGEKSNDTITLRSNQFMVYMPYDEDTMLLTNNKRIHISKSNVECRPYLLTRADDINYCYGEKGVLNVIFTQTEFNKGKDKLITLDDDTEIWICDYRDITITNLPSQDTEYTTSNVKITGNKELKLGYTKKYTVWFTDSNGNPTDVEYSWNIVSNFEVGQNVVDDGIELKVSNDSFLDESFLLQVIVNEEIIAEKEITIVDGL